MDIIIDATWIGSRYGSNDINGGYRVIDNFIKQLYRYPEHSFYLTHTTFRNDFTTNLNRYLDNISKPPNVTVEARTFKFLDSDLGRKWYARISNRVPVNSLISFLPSKVIQKANIYHSPVDSIPYSIRRNKKTIKFFTALDLLPLIRPDLSILYHSHIKNLYDKLTTDTNIIAISQSTKRDILSYRPDINENKIRVIYLAADKNIFYPVDNLLEIDEIRRKYNILTKKYFLTINNIAPYKNSKFVLSHFYGWSKKNSIEDVSFVVIGRKMDKIYSNELMDEIKHSDRIIFLENIPDYELAALYSGAMCFIYMSKYEGFGLPVLESLQCGTPVICSNTSSIPEIAGDSALLSHPEDKDAFIQSLDCIYRNEYTRNKLKDLGLKRAGLFSWEKHADQILQFYEDNLE